MVEIQLSEYGHVAHQIVGNHECSNMVANILPADPQPPPPPPPPPPDHGGGDNRSKIQLFQIKGIMNAATL